MALTACPECQKQVSSAASACPGCGHPMGSAPIPVRIAPPEKEGMGLGAKLGIAALVLVGGFLLFGALLPENVVRANEARRACMEMVKQGLGTEYQCDKIAADIRARKG